MRLEKIQKLNWKHYFILKSLFSNDLKELTTPELVEKMKFYFKLYGVRVSNYQGTRTLLNRQLDVLIDLKLISKSVSSTNSYKINPRYEGVCYNLIIGFFGILDLKGDD